MQAAIHPTGDRRDLPCRAPGAKANATVAEVICPIGSIRPSVTPAISAFSWALSRVDASIVHRPGLPRLIPSTCHFIVFALPQ
jgi:hypothetical protein